MDKIMIMMMTMMIIKIMIMMTSLCLTSVGFRFKYVKENAELMAHSRMPAIATANRSLAIS